VAMAGDHLPLDSTFASSSSGVNAASFARLKLRSPRRRLAGAEASCGSRCTPAPLQLVYLCGRGQVKTKIFA